MTAAEDLVERIVEWLALRARRSSQKIGDRRVHIWRIVQEDGSTLRRLISDAARAGRRRTIEAEADIFGLKVE